MPPEARQKLKDKLQAIEDAVTRQELLKAIEAMLVFEKNLGKRTEAELTAIKKAVDSAIERMHTIAVNEAETVVGQAREELVAKFDEDMSKMMLEHESMMAECDAKMAGMKDGEDGIDADEQKVIEAVLAQIPPVKELEPETPESVRDKLESIEVEENKLAISAIRNLEEELKKLRKQITDISSRPVVGGLASRDIVKNYDISSQLNGVTKTFQTPAMFRVITVMLSSTPSALRENVDYTWTDTSITFTSEIEASTSLASGQSAIILYTSL